MGSNVSEELGEEVAVIARRRAPSRGQPIEARLWSRELSKWVFARGLVQGRDAGPGTRSHAELGRKPNSIERRSTGDADKRVLVHNPARRLDK
jgi:hypothetical protein